jgi:outer membrane protein assembly factor BamE
MLSMLSRAAGALLIVLSTGCGSLLPNFYTVPVRQGNFIDQAMVSQLRPGMTRQQVQQIMGTPLVTDPFHQDRWDYYYRFKQDGSPVEQRHITLFFRGDLLDRVEGAVN